MEFFKKDPPGILENYFGFFFCIFFFEIHRWFFLKVFVNQEKIILKELWIFWKRNCWSYGNSSRSCFVWYLPVYFLEVCQKCLIDFFYVFYVFSARGWFILVLIFFFNNALNNSSECSIENLKVSLWVLSKLFVFLPQVSWMFSQIMSRIQSDVHQRIFQE